MANFIFNWANAALLATTLDLSVGNYYAHLVTTAPVLGNSTVANLELPTASGYAATPLTGLSYTSARWTFDSFNFPKYAFASVPVGVVICRRTGVVPASTDGVICYSDFNNSIGQVITLQVGTYILNLEFGISGAINFKNLYQYNSGAYNSAVAVIPPGLVGLIGTKNSTVAYANPFTTLTSSQNLGLLGSATDIGTAAYTNKTIEAVATFVRRYSFDFGTLAVKPTTFGFVHRDALTKVVQLWGSNYIPAFDRASIDNSSFWTLLGSVGSPLSIGWNFISVSNPTFWRYFKLMSSDNTVTLSLQEIEFYNSSVLSPTLNMV